MSPCLPMGAVMDESARKHRAPLPLGLVGMIFLIALAERGFHRGARHTGDKGVSWSFAARAAAGAARDAEVVILGDSMMKFGIVPRAIEARTGWRAYNLALFDGPPLASLAILERLFQGGTRPRVVLLNLMPHQLNRSLHDDKHAGAWGQLLSLPEAWRELLRFRALGVFADVVYTACLPSLANRAELRTTILWAFAARDRSTQGIARLYLRNWNANQGAHILRSKGQAAPFRGNNHELAPVSWAARPEMLDVVRRLLSIAQARGTRVCLLISPLHPEAQQKLAEIGLYSRYEETLRTLQQEFDNLEVFDGRSLRLGAACFADGVHLHHEGAIALSEACGEALRDQTGARWVELRAVDRPARTVPVEDIEESRMALRDERRARR